MMKIIKHIKSFINNQKGVAAIETGIYISVSLLVIAIAVDYGMVMIKQSKIDRLSYSLASVIRERTAVYLATNQNVASSLNIEDITQEQVNELHRFGVDLLGDKSLGLTFSALYFQPGSTKTISREETFSASLNTDSKCTDEPAMQSTPTIINLSPYSTYKRWMPLYRVTVCIPNSASMFKKMLSLSDKSSPDFLISSSIVVPKT